MTSSSSRIPEKRVEDLPPKLFARAEQLIVYRHLPTTTPATDGSHRRQSRRLPESRWVEQEIGTRS